MFTARKRHLKKKRAFLEKQSTFALLNGSNLKTSKIAKIRLSLTNAKLYSMPLYLNPPKLALGYPIIIIVYDTLNDLKKNLPKILTKIDCIGVFINKAYYPVEIFQENKLTNLNEKLLSMLLKKNSKKKTT